MARARRAASRRSMRAPPGWSGDYGRPSAAWQGRSRRARRVTRIMIVNASDSALARSRQRAARLRSRSARLAAGPGSRACGRSSRARARASCAARGIEPSQCAIVASISSRSTSASGVPTRSATRSRVGSAPARRAAPAAPRPGRRRRLPARSSAISAGSIAGVTSGPSCSTTMLRMTLRSWRTLPGQGAARQDRRRLGVEAGEGLALLGGELDEARLGDVHDVLGPRAQRRHVDRHDVQPVVEVLAEAARPAPPRPGRGWWRRRCARRPGSAAPRRPAGSSRSAGSAGAWSAARGPSRRSRRGRACRRRRPPPRPACRRARR